MRRASASSIDKMTPADTNEIEALLVGLNLGPTELWDALSETVSNREGVKQLLDRLSAWSLRGSSASSIWALRSYGANQYEGTRP